MKNQTLFAAMIFALLTFACLETSALGQVAKEGSLATASTAGSTVRFDTAVANSGGTITISGPDGRIFRKEFRAGVLPEFGLTDSQGERLTDGTYTYELRLAPASQAANKEALQAARGNDDDPETERAARKSPGVPNLVQSGSFAFLNGQVIIAGSLQEPARFDKTIDQPRGSGGGVISGNTVKRLRNHRFSLLTMPDQVIADDLIVQGSACVGLDCVNNESFGFDTIRLKENNTRLKFDDTSTSAGFPNHDWQLTANDSASGGANKFSIEEITAATVPFTIIGNAPTNSIFVDSVGRVGFRTGAPVLDLHITTGNTPAHRFEQTTAGGFSAQTWDIGANEANWFVRDVTGGSRLPLRIRPGAPTSSVDISATGNVGIGTATPGAKLHVNGSDSRSITLVNGGTKGVRIGADGGGGIVEGVDSTGAGSYQPLAIGGSIVTFGIASVEKMRVNTDGSVGIGTIAPTSLLSVNGTADKPGGGAWGVFSDERLKNIKGQFNSGLKAVMQLQPIRYEYKPDNALGLKSNGEHIGFGAQSLQKVIPEAVTKNSAGYLMVNNDPILWTMLNAIKEQQKEIEQLKGQIRKLQTPRRRHRSR